MRGSKVFLIASLALLGLATAAEAVDKFKCKAGGRTYELTPGDWPIEAVLMWDKTSTDCDIIVDDGAGSIIALGIGIEPRFERVAFGPLPGVPIQITVIKASGPNSNAYFRSADSADFLSRFIPDAAGEGLRYLGTASELAQKDPEYAQVLDTWKRFRDLKALSDSD